LIYGPEGLEPLSQDGPRSAIVTNYYYPDTKVSSGTFYLMINQPYLPTIIVRNKHENPRKCSILPLKGRADLHFVTYPVEQKLCLEGYIRLAPDAAPLNKNDSRFGILLLDGSWRWADVMNRDFTNLPARSLQGYRTAYPRKSKLGTDPENGLASVEALYLVHYLLGRPTEGLLDHYHWREEFLRLNGLNEAD
jgi:pre-rRNA-processing protein TSR3